MDISNKEIGKLMFKHEMTLYEAIANISFCSGSETRKTMEEMSEILDRFIGFSSANNSVKNSIHKRQTINNPYDLGDAYYSEIGRFALKYDTTWRMTIAYLLHKEGLTCVQIGERMTVFYNKEVHENLARKFRRDAFLKIGPDIRLPEMNNNLSVNYEEIGKLACEYNLIRIEALTYTLAQEGFRTCEISEKISEFFNRRIKSSTISSVKRKVSEKLKNETERAKRVETMEIDHAAIGRLVIMYDLTPSQAMIYHFSQDHDIHEIQNIMANILGKTISLSHICSVRKTAFMRVED